MAIDPRHLFDQAEHLTRPARAGAPRQADLRRAISAAYYGVFHATLAAAANLFVGKARRSRRQYALAYRSVDHAALRELCSQAMKLTLSDRWARHAPPRGFGPNIAAFAETVIDLQAKRLEADYNPDARFKRSDALVAVDRARRALVRFRKASARRQRAFLALLIFRPR